MTLEGRIAVDVSFSDSTSTSGVQSLKKISLVDTTSYATGKVAILTGTAGGISQTIVSNGLTTFRNAAGQIVDFGSSATSISRAAIQASADDVFVGDGVNAIYLAKSVVTVFKPQGSTITVSTPGPTASYTIVLYGT